MPEFENLEPFLDREGGRIMPVAPHSTRAHDFVLRRRAAPAARMVRRPAGEAPDPKPVEGAERLTTQEMERAYRAAMKESRAKDKLHARRQGKTIWRRLNRWLKRLLGVGGSRKKAQPTRARKPRSNAEGTAAKPDPRHRKASARSGPGRAPKHSTSSPQPEEHPRPRTPKKSTRNRNRRRGPNSPEGSSPREPASTGTSSISSGNAAAKPTANGNRSRRRRNRGSRGSGGKEASSGPQPHSAE